MNWLTLHWERLARRDPFYAVFTDVDRRFAGRDLEQFYRSGTDEIASVLDAAEQLGLTVPRRRALDFGCGVGRLTQALAESFTRCDGVDISSAMLAVARQHCRKPERCAFHWNVAENLALFEDGTFTFAYSTLVLQHMTPRLSTIYIRELVRVLAADGLLVFQLPSHRVERAALPSDVRSPVYGPLPPAAFAARLFANSPVLTGHAGERMLIEVTVENHSPEVWRSLPDTRGRYQISVANHWLTERGVILQQDDERCPLPCDVLPGARAEMILGVRPPRVNGRYLLELDVVQENVGWFAEEGSQPLRIPCEVTGGIDPPPEPPIVLAPATLRPFRERHPQIFTALRAIGIRDMYWSWRRGLDRFKAHRDAVIRRHLHPIVQNHLHPVIRRRVHPLINQWRRVSFAPKMEMHCVPRAEVAEIVNESGGHVVRVDEELMAGGYHSCRYWVTKV